jgi:hypothetical protein
MLSILVQGRDLAGLSEDIDAFFQLYHVFSPFWLRMDNGAADKFHPADQMHPAD